MPIRIAPVMGTTVTIDVRDWQFPIDVLDEAVLVLEQLEARFSTYRADSEISRIDRGELAVADAHPDVREVLDTCAVLRAESNGAFDAWRGDHLDPSGYVKGWAGERAADVLRAAGAKHFSLNIGGDVLCAGGRGDGAPWRVGVRSPSDPKMITLVLGVRDGAVATSGLYERGDHVTDARSDEAPRSWSSVSVLAPDLATADAIATAALAIGPEGPAWAARRPTCAVAAIDPSGALWTSSALEAARVA
jgi:thiamine biosynthesis lipoprotein